MAIQTEKEQQDAVGPAIRRAGFPSSMSRDLYRETEVLTAPPEKLVVMLYDGLNRFLLQASRLFQDADFAAAEGKLTRAEAIIDELMATLDLSVGEVATNLFGIYVFSRSELMDARKDRDGGKVERVRALLIELRESWTQVNSS